MRISDWSSDVCSSDLAVPVDARHPPDQQFGGAVEAEDLHFLRAEGADADLRHPDRLVGRHRLDLRDPGRPVVERPEVPVEREAVHRHDIRSEEHTSELQSLMRISYAVFCLKKKNKQTTH